MLACVGIVSAQTAATYISQIVIPGTTNDSVARTQLRRLSNFTFRPGAETERVGQETALLTGLQQRPEWEVKSFLMGESQIQGKLASINPLAGYLADTNLCEPATQALMGISTTEGANSVIPVIRAALLASSGKCQVTLMRAAGSLRDGDAAVVNLLIQQAASANRGTRDIALRGLANIGDPLGAAALATARSSTNAFDRSRAIDISLLFALREAQRGDRAGGIALANAIRATAVPDTNARHVVANADTTLNRIGLVVPIHTRVERAITGFSVNGKSRSQISIRVEETGRFRLRISDTQGKVLQELKGDKPGEYLLNVNFNPSGLYWVVWEGNSGRYTRPITLF